MKLARLVVLAVLLAFTSHAGEGQSQLKYQPGFDFGSVGIDFTVYHPYKVYNAGNQAVRITRLDKGCDCTSLTKSDSVIRPNDSVLINATFDTRNQYGPLNKTFKVLTDDPANQELTFYYTADVGQWPDGIKPDPVSLFLLPVHKSKPLTVPNRSFNMMGLAAYEIAFPQCEVTVIKSEAAKGENLQLEITPKADVRAGTYKSSITLTLTGDENQRFILTVPIKIVRY